MGLPRFTHMKASGLEEALEMLREKGEEAKVIAGGTDLLVQLKQRTITPRYVLDIKWLEDLKGVSVAEDGRVRIGALEPLESVANSEEIRRRFPVLARAAGRVGSVQIRNVGTLGGNICLETRCWYYNQSARWRRSIPRCFKLGGEQCLVIGKSRKCNGVFLADTVPALIALGARLRIRKKDGERELPVEDFYGDSGHPSNLLARDEILTEVLLPEIGPNCHGVFLKDAPRAVVDFALVNVALGLSFREGGETCEDARIAVAGVTSYPVRAVEAEEVLKAEKPTEEIVEEVAELVIKAASPISSIWVSANQRRRTLRVLVKRGIKEALRRHRGE